ncbi:LysR family transcriptional regulator [Robbsia sp. KACC 23696]|uniref:LysR family transcriptional regulator n=1 Tax=Robbsia sp. KACC 23696 TaxID=3149231 RepID=UPI00325B7D5F
MLNKIEMLRIFCAAVDAASFKDAATRLAISPQAVTRAVHEAERATGEVLFHRNTRRVNVTQAGAQFAQQARELVAQVDRLLGNRDVGAAAEVMGTVRMTVPKSIGEILLLPLVTDMANRYPHLTIDLRLSDTIVDPVAEQIDIGVRIGFLQDSRFVAREVAKVGFVVVGAPRLIDRVGLPHNLAHMAELPTTGYVDRRTGRPWPWQLADGQQFTPVRLVFQTDDTEAESQAVVAGLGFTQMASYIARPWIEAGKLVRVLADLEPEPWPVCVYRPQRGPVPARIRVVFDATVAALENAGL